MVHISGSQKKLAIFLSVLTGAFVIGGIAWLFPTASNEGFAPVQPIPFSHRLHAGVNKIPCMYCHSGAEKSRHALIPSLNVCMNCHSVVKTDSPYIQKVRKAYAEGKPIQWVRVHELPDYVYFAHKRHVAMGVRCETCHGKVQEMDRIEQKGALTMGWCIECHRGQTTPAEVLAKVYPHMINPRGPVAPTSCNTCHN